MFQVMQYKPPRDIQWEFQSSLLSLQDEGLNKQHSHFHFAVKKVQKTRLQQGATLALPIFLSKNNQKVVMGRYQKCQSQTNLDVPPILHLQ